ncbi:MAG: thioredoxin domain-containing protein [Edaphobacter sp.]|uniref:DsbA family protein n=1 Tax=Edaphobacter sp. TaxID=1934404 RepID=UPI00239B2D90|nr:thioredoxin domain-containing protein [Edaphobacter sp.]MDE1177037.1 thioredoxin domain-containing protein [Edaphobacter sp.]
MLNVARLSHLSLLALMLVPAGCHAQSPTGGKLSPELERRVEILLRAKTNLPPTYDVMIGPRTHSDVPGYDEISVIFTSEGKTTKPMTFLLSTDGKTVAQFSKFDISKDPKALVTDSGRPSRGGPASAPVTIVGFDDLECPFCAKMHSALFPALQERYKDQVRIVYKDFPLEQIHPWAVRGAIDANCLAAQSATGYWNYVDYVHGHVGEIGGTEKTLAKANENLDTLAKDEGKRQKVNEVTLNACIEKQEDTAIKASVKEGMDLGLEATPVLYINGEKLEGAFPIEYVYRMIDKALIAEGKTPPPPPPAPVAAPSAPAAGNATQPANHAGSQK